MCIGGGESVWDGGWASIIAASQENACNVQKDLDMGWEGWDLPTSNCNLCRQFCDICRQFFDACPDFFGAC